MKRPVLEPVGDSRLERKSSIYQHAGKLSVMKLGEWCPLVYDVIDGITCGKIISHKACVTDDPNDIGYTFPVKTCKYVSDIYLLGDRQETLIKPLPTWFGTGLYEDRINEQVFLTDGANALSSHKIAIRRIGKDYCVAKTSLVAVE